MVNLGYDFLADSKENREGSLIDGKRIKTRPFFFQGQFHGHRPDIPNFQNSEYMADYMKPWVSQLQKWMENGTLVSHSHNPDHNAFLGTDRLIHKTTIEPNKPRLW